MNISIGWSVSAEGIIIHKCLHSDVAGDVDPRLLHLAYPNEMQGESAQTLKREREGVVEQRGAAMGVAEFDRKAEAVEKQMGVGQGQRSAVEESMCLRRKLRGCLHIW